MEFTVEEVSPVKKKIAITVAPEEVDAALAGALALVKQNAQIDGFRKGKVPAHVVEKRFHDSIEKEARDNLINVHINDIVTKTESRPMSPIKMTGDDQPLRKGQPFTYSMEFEVMPAFDLPPYEGLEVEEETPGLAEEQIDGLIEKIRKEKAPIVPVDGNQPVRDGQIAVLDFQPYENGNPMEGWKATAINLEIGAGEALEDFENLVKTIPVGHTGEKSITFPEDFLSPELAGKTVLMKVTVHAVKERRLPEINDELARNSGFKDLADMRKKLADSAEAVMGNLMKAEAQKKLLDMLVKQTSFPLPPNLVKTETYFLISDYAERMERMGKSIAATKDDLEKLRQETTPQGEIRAREKIILLNIAKKENLEVSQEEVVREIYRGSQKMGLDFKEYYARMEDSGMVFQLRDNMLCDKAMDLVYERANVKKVAPRILNDAPAEENAPAGDENGAGSGETAPVENNS